MKKLAIIVVILLIAGFVWFRFFHKKSKVNFTTVKVTRGTLTSLVEATGTLEPVGTTSVDSTGTVTGGITVGAQVTGRIMSVNVDFNSHVKKGELLAQIDPLTYQASVDQDQASIANLSAQRLKDQATMANDKINYNREVLLVQKNYDSRQNLDNSKYAYESQSAAVQADAAQIDQARAKLKQDEANLTYTHIISPVDGIVVANNVALGQTVVASLQSPNLFVIAKSLENMQIDTLVDEADVNKIKVAQPANFNVDSFPNKTFTGAVYQIRQNPIQQQNVVDYDVIVHVKNKENALLPGMTANVSFIVAQKMNVLKIPNRALLFSPPQRKSQQGSTTGFTTSLVPKKVVPHVYVLEGSRSVRKNIKVGIASDSETEVLSGLNEGDQVITGTASAQSTKKNPYSTF